MQILGNGQSVLVRPSSFRVFDLLDEVRQWAGTLQKSDASAALLKIFGRRNRKEGGEADAKQNRRGEHEAKNPKTNTKRSPTKKERMAEKKNQAGSRVKVRKSNSNFTAAQSLQQSMGSRNTLTRNYLPLAPFHLFFARKHPRKKKSPSCQAPPRRCSRRFGALARRRLKEPVICCARPKTPHGPLLNVANL